MSLYSLLLLLRRDILTLRYTETFWLSAAQRRVRRLQKTHEMAGHPTGHQGLAARLYAALVSILLFLLNTLRTIVAFCLLAASHTLRYLITLIRGRVHLEQAPVDAGMPPHSSSTPVDTIMDFTSGSGLTALFDSILPAFDGIETEDNWRQRDRGITSIRSVYRGNAPVTLRKELIVCTRTSMDGILKAAHSLRTSLATNGLQLLQEIFKHVGGDLDPQLDTVTTSLIKLTSGTKTLTANAANDAIIIIFETCGFQSRFLHHILESSKDKNVRPRAFAMGWLIAVLTTYAEKKSVLEHGTNLESITRSIQNGLTDADAGVRERARDAFWAFQPLWPEKADSILQSLKPAAQKLLNQKQPTNQSVICDYKPPPPLRPRGDTHASAPISLTPTLVSNTTTPFSRATAVDTAATSNGMAEAPRRPHRATKETRKENVMPVNAEPKRVAAISDVDQAAELASCRRLVHGHLDDFGTLTKLATRLQAGQYGNLAVSQFGHILLRSIQNSADPKSPLLLKQITVLRRAVDRYRDATAAHVEPACIKIGELLYKTNAKDRNYELLMDHYTFFLGNCDPQAQGARVLTLCEQVRAKPRTTSSTAVEIEAWSALLPKRPVDPHVGGSLRELLEVGLATGEDQRTWIEFGVVLHQAIGVERFWKGLSLRDDTKALLLYYIAKHDTPAA